MLPNLEFLIQKIPNYTGKHLWNGKIPEISSTTIDFTHYPDYRSETKHHNIYDIVFFAENTIDFAGWNILCDELIRAVKNDGILVIKYLQNNNITVISLKNFFFRKYGLAVELIYENISGGIFINAFQIHKIHLNNSKLWSFGLLVGQNEDKIQNTLKMCQSIRKFGGDAHEIIITGYYDQRFQDYNTTYINKQYSTIYADICKKKNDIIQTAIHENILIAHDRYWLNEDFFEGFDKYGYDFEFITAKQICLSGREYPAYCAVDDNNNLSWPACGYHLKVYNKQIFQNYCNGGLIIGKKHVLSNIPFNSMLFHNQAEDVELAKEMQKQHIILKINNFSSITTNVDENSLGFFSLYEKPNTQQTTEIPKHNVYKPKRKYIKLRNLRNKIRLLISKPFIKKDKTSANLLFAFISNGQFIYACYLARHLISKGIKLRLYKYILSTTKNKLIQSSTIFLTSNH